MKIAIRGHESRGKEVIQILESLGGKNSILLEGTNQYVYYGIYENEIMVLSNFTKYKRYTLEEFEKEFPFKVGDKVKDCSDDEIGIILGFIDIDNELMYVVNFEKSGHANMPAEELKPKEMQERNITLTLDKAKEWYNKGGELKEVALQAYSEEELSKVELPKSWEEFCANYPIQTGEAIIDEETSQIRCYYGMVARGLVKDKNICPSKKSAEAHLAMIQLEQLRNCWWNGWKADWNNLQQAKHCIVHSRELKIHILYETRRFLSFPTTEMAKEFLKCFRDLIEKAGDLI